MNYFTCASVWRAAKECVFQPLRRRFEDPDLKEADGEGGICSCVNCNLTKIPSGPELNPNTTELNLSSNNITVLENNNFSEFSKLEVLNLSNNNLETVDVLAFHGLENLKTLDLSHNLIAELPANIQFPSKQLEQLKLNNNSLTNLDIREALKDLRTPLKVALGGNPWDCSCSLMNLSLWLNSSTVSLGNSWRFLVGVLAVGAVTLLLIIIAVKFPRWYDYVLSYNHHRLKDEEPYTFEEEFNVDFNMSTNDKNLEEEETVVVFEQTHSFVPEDDGFIEDKYIDERDMTVES
ncbi:leucine-rich repeat-containing protein 19 [Gastrophryne carolinensis]